MTGQIRRRLMIVSVAAILPFGAMVFYLIAAEKHRAEEEALQHAASVAGLIAAKASLIVEHSGQLLASRASSRDNSTLLGPHCQSELNALLKLHSLYGFAGVCDGNGKIVCSSASADGSPLDFSDRDHFKKALASGQVTMSGLIESRVTGKKVVVLLQPMFSGGRLLGLLGAELDLAWLEVMLRDAKLPRGGVVALVDGKGAVFSSFPDSGFAGKSFADAAQFSRMVAARPEGSTTIVGPDNVERLTAYARVKNVPSEHGAYVSVSIPSTALHNAAERTVRDGILAAGLVLCLSLLAVWIGARFFVFPQLGGLPGCGQQRKITGRYRPTRGQERFTYEATWHQSGTVIIWDAQVRLEERLVGLPSGEVLVGGATDLAGLVRREVESAIDHRLTLD